MNTILCGCSYIHKHTLLYENKNTGTTEGKSWLKASFPSCLQASARASKAELLTSLTTSGSCHLRVLWRCSRLLGDRRRTWMCSCLPSCCPLWGKTCSPHEDRKLGFVNRIHDLTASLAITARWLFSFQSCKWFVVLLEKCSPVRLLLFEEEDLQLQTFSWSNIFTL